MTSHKTIVLMAGGTGGHIFPALAVGNYLRERGWNLHWLGSENGMEVELVPNQKIPMTLLPVSGVRKKGVMALIKAPFKILSSVLLARRMIKKIKPDVVLGMGGFASGPGGLAAKLCGVPLVIHEQNAIAGLTNRQLNRLSLWTLQAYPGAFPQREKVVTTGNPVRKDLLTVTEASKRINKEDGQINILIVGGSRGAAILNDCIPQTMNIINDGLNITIRHQTGKNNAQKVFDAYQQGTNNRVTYQVTEFIDDMAEAYCWAELVICRAGALTVAEVAMAGCAAIFVPYPYAVDDHQTHNARYLADKEAAVIIPQHDLTAQRLAEQITTLANNKQHIINMAELARQLAKPQATEEVANYCIKAAIGHQEVSA